MNNRILVVEDSRSFRNYLNNQISQINMEVVSTESLKEAKAILENDTDFLCAVLDFCLPDGPDGEVIDLALSYDMKVIVVTGQFDEQLRDAMLAKGVIDYILKDSFASISYLLPLLTRLNRNKCHKALVVDDSLTVRRHLVQLLDHHYIRSVQAEDGVEALEILKADPEITLIITDNTMPEKDGISMTREIRLTYDRSQLAILGLSTAESKTVTAQFLKAGANDYLKKPFNQEEFYCRIQNLLNMKDISDDMFKMANQDALTGLWNRRYLFSNADNNKEQRNVAMLDIDFFKRINDNYGHEAGDQALVTISHIIAIYFKEDLAARIGGEEFCIVNYGDYDAFVQRLDNMRQRIEKTAIPYNGEDIKLTMSIGVTRAKRDIDTMIRIADERLYAAKETGRNRVISEDVD
ncbi:diguanylate cyclase [Vibrio sp. DW001]|uniref:diguanylate cyclase n=1 Tax=Vibrio sp. DW001 TaxID=2912315 RepID=UPI0023B1E0F6|nr:diguanylate cyclase [Vibrio sp. DW001]WED26025.1 diguanylate cyclase [Vibrio sp. DW001]